MARETPNINPSLQRMVNNSIVAQTLGSVEEYERNKSRTYDHIHPNRLLTRADFSDTQVAHMVRMLMRDDMSHETVCVMARDRILCLVKEKAELEKKIRLLEKGA